MAKHTLNSLLFSFLDPHRRKSATLLIFLFLFLVLRLDLARFDGFVYTDLMRCIQIDLKFDWNYYCGNGYMIIL